MAKARELEKMHEYDEELLDELASKIVSEEDFSKILKGLSNKTDPLKTLLELHV